MDPQALTELHQTGKQPVRHLEPPWTGRQISLFDGGAVKQTPGCYCPMAFKIFYCNYIISLDAVARWPRRAS